MSFSNEYTQFPPPQAPLLPNLHSFPCSFCHEGNCFHHLSHPHQMGFLIPQDPNPTTPSPTFLYEPTCNRRSSLAKKDRHTKISTAQGVRDRRVRLSMEIAREFFDLQDMLGFDKASMTLGWLLTKSKDAIQELALAKQGIDASGSSSCASQEEAIAKSASGSKEEISEKLSEENQANALVARANRAKARARARERTKEKLYTVANPIQFENHGFEPSGGETDYSSQSQDLVSRSLHLLGCGSETDKVAHPHLMDGTNVTRSNHFLPTLGFPDGPLSAPSGDQGFVRVNNNPNLLLGRNVEATSSSGWNMLTAPNEMHMTINQWETWDNR